MFSCTLVWAEQGEHKVQTEPGLRNFLLEEYTAIHCSYCPSAHVIAKDLHAVFGDRIQTLAVHVSSLADPGTGEIDFRTDFGEMWFAQLGRGGVPSGSINRQSFEGFTDEGTYDINRSLWPQVIRSIMYDTAQVNIYAQAEMDTMTRELSVKVELYYPEKVDDDFNTITVVLTENFIRGTQSGGGASSNYLHQHVVSDLLTGVWGDTLQDLSKGVVIEKTFTTTVPEMYNNRMPNLSNLEVVVFVSNSKGEVLNSESALVLFPGRYVVPSAELRVTGISEYFARTSIPVRVMNLGTDTLQSVKLAVDWGSEKYEPEVTGLSIPYGKEQEVWFELGEYPFTQVMKYRIVTQQLNGETFESNLISDFTFWPYEVNSDSVTINVRTTTKGSDLSWTLRTRDGQVIYESEPYEEGKVQEETLSLFLEDGVVYSLEIEDAFLDGFSGGFSITDQNGKVIAKQDYLGSYGEKISFVKAEDVSDEELYPVKESGLEIFPNPVLKGQDVKVCLDFKTCSPVIVKVFDMQGRCCKMENISVSSDCFLLETSNLQSGMYLVHVTDGVGDAVVKLLVR